MAASLKLSRSAPFWLIFRGSYRHHLSAGSDSGYELQVVLKCSGVHYALKIVDKHLILRHKQVLLISTGLLS